LFVISGFLITGPLLADAADGVVSFSKFYSRRALRILPAATVVILATGVASLLILNSVRAKAVLADSLWASVFAANVKFGRDGTDYFSEAAVSPLQHFWSLAVEEQFYLVWPAVLALAVIGLPVLQARLGGESRPAATLARCLASASRWCWRSAGRPRCCCRSGRRPRTDPTAYFSAFPPRLGAGRRCPLATGLPLLGRLPDTVRSALTWAGVAGIGITAVAYDRTPLTELGSDAAGACDVRRPRGRHRRAQLGANHLLGRQPLRFVGISPIRCPAGVKAAVLAAHHADPIPSNLEPSFDHILQDRTKSVIPADTRRTESQICQNDDAQGTRKVVLFGNSHPVAWLPAVSRVARDAGWQFFPMVKEVCDDGGDQPRPDHRERVRRR